MVKLSKAGARWGFTNCHQSGNFTASPSFFHRLFILSPAKSLPFFYIQIKETKKKDT